MKIAIVSNNYFSDNFDQLKQTLTSVCSNCEVNLFQYHEYAEIYSALTEYAPNVLFTENLAGFNMSTLTGGPVYNLLNARQYHLIHDPKAITEKVSSYLAHPLSLSMHFLCSDSGIKEKLTTLNPDIPYIDVLKKPYTDTSAISNILLNRSL